MLITDSVLHWLQTHFVLNLVEVILLLYRP